MGMGEYSTSFLHEYCPNRLLVSIDNEVKWFEKFTKLGSDTHKIKIEPNWDDATSYLQSIPWDVVLIDHHPCERRVVDIELLMHNAKFIVIHDTEPRALAAHEYNYEPTLSLFKYRWDFRKLYPNTTVVSMTDPIPQSVLDCENLHYP
jgi:hypothetical protein